MFPVELDLECSPVVNAMGEAVGPLCFDDMFELIADEVDAMKEVVRPREPKIVEQARRELAQIE